MSHATLILTGHGPRRGSSPAFPVGGILLAAATVSVVASLLTTLWLNRSPEVAAMSVVPLAQGVPVAPAGAPGSPGTGVPDASTVFAGHDAPVEEPVPTF